MPKRTLFEKIPDSCGWKHYDYIENYIHGPKPRSVNEWIGRHAQFCKKVDDHAAIATFLTPTAATVEWKVHSLIDASIPQGPEGKNPAWQNERNKCDITASNAGKILGVGMQQGPCTYLRDVIRPDLKKKDAWSQRNFDHGHKFEPEVRKEFLKKFGFTRLVNSTDPSNGAGLITKSLDNGRYLFGFTPDDFIIKNRHISLAEFKCPVSRLLEDVIPFDYYVQIQFELNMLYDMAAPLTDCYYAEYRLKEDTNDPVWRGSLNVWRVVIDREFWAYALPLIKSWVDVMHYLKPHAHDAEFAEFLKYECRATHREKRAQSGKRKFGVEEPEDLLDDSSNEDDEDDEDGGGIFSECKPLSAYVGQPLSSFTKKPEKPQQEASPPSSSSTKHDEVIPSPPSPPPVPQPSPASPAPVCIHAPICIPGHAEPKSVQEFTCEEVVSKLSILRETLRNFDVKFIALLESVAGLPKCSVEVSAIFAATATYVQSICPNVDERTSDPWLNQRFIDQSKRDHLTEHEYEELKQLYLVSWRRWWEKQLETRSYRLFTEVPAPFEIFRHYPTP